MDIDECVVVLPHDRAQVEPRGAALLRRVHEERLPVIPSSVALGLGLGAATVLLQNSPGYVGPLYRTLAGAVTPLRSAGWLRIVTVPRTASAFSCG
jgi:hypothetical protein